MDIHVLSIFIYITVACVTEISAISATHYYRSIIEAHVVPKLYFFIHFKKVNTLIFLMIQRNYHGYSCVIYFYIHNCGLLCGGISNIITSHHHRSSQIKAFLKVTWLL
jgi:hypothetical protein